VVGQAVRDHVDRVDLDQAVQVPVGRAVFPEGLVDQAGAGPVGALPIWEKLGTIRNTRSNG
jgi:hypothetical protein